MSNVFEIDLDEFPEFPQDPSELTIFIKAHYNLLARLKTKRVKGMRPWLISLGQAICRTGIKPEKMSARQLCAAIFAVNKLFHSGMPEAETTKASLQTELLVHHYGRCRARYVSKGANRGTYLARVGFWEIHIPANIFEEVEPPRRKLQPVRRRFGVK